MQRPSKTAIICLPYERTTQFRKGCSPAPDAIINELAYMDTFDVSLGFDPFDNSAVKVVIPHDEDVIDPEIQQTIAATAANEMHTDGFFVVSIGGEHTVSLGPIRAMRQQGPLGVVQLDARANLENSHNGFRNSHHCVMRRIEEMGIPTLGVGIRAMSETEFRYVEQRKFPIVHARRVITDQSWYHMLDRLPARIYLTIDLGFFDPSQVPNTTMPIPGGPSYEDALAFIDHLFHTREVIATDIVELTTGNNDAAGVRLAARLLTHIVGLAMS